MPTSNKATLPQADGLALAIPRLELARVLRKKRDPDEATKLAAISAALAAVASGGGQLLHHDESDLYLLPVLGAMWMKGPRVSVPTHGQNAKQDFFGALDVVSGVFHWDDHDRKLAVYFLRFLKRLAAAYPEGPLFLVMDGAPSHTANIIIAWLAANLHVQVLGLSRNSAREANSAERIWGLMKGAVAPNRLAGSIGDLVANASNFFEHDPPS